MASGRISMHQEMELEEAILLGDAKTEIAQIKEDLIKYLVRWGLVCFKIKYLHKLRNRSSASSSNIHNGKNQKGILHTAFFQGVVNQFIDFLNVEEFWNDRNTERRRPNRFDLKDIDTELTDLVRRKTFVYEAVNSLVRKFNKLAEEKLIGLLVAKISSFRSSLVSLKQVNEMIEEIQSF